MWSELTQTFPASSRSAAARGLPRAGGPLGGGGPEGGGMGRGGGAAGGGLAQVARPDGGAETVDGTIGAGDGFVEVLNFEDGQRRAERLLLDDAGVVGDAGKERRQGKEALGEFGAVRPLAAGENLPAALDRVGHLLFDLLALRGGVERPEAGLFVEAVPDLQPLRLANELFDELVVDGFKKIEPLDGEAGLAAVVEAADGGAGDGGVQ